jgi:hypothetical protein
MRFRKLRIAWSVWCGVASVLLIVLWVRSYWEYDLVQGPTSAGNLVFSSSWQGRIQGRIIPWPGASSRNKEWSWYPTPAEDQKRLFERLNIDWELPPVFSVIIRKSIWNVTVAHWLLVIVAATFTIVPWIPWSTRFSLRTLLIATTLVAVVLGLAVYATRK